MEEISVDAAGQIDALNSSAWERRNDSSNEAQLLAEQAHARANQEHYAKGIAEALCTLSWRDMLSGNPREALRQAESALAIAEDLDIKILTARISTTIGGIYKSISEYGKAFEYFMRTLALRREIGDTGGVAAALGNIGIISALTSNYSEAIEYQRQSLALEEELGNIRGEALSLNEIGNVYWYTSDYGNALEYYLKAYQKFEEIADKRGTAFVLNNIGLIYNTISEYDKALHYFMQALAIKEEINDKNGAALTLANIGNSYFAMSDYSKALEYFSNALLIQEELGDQHGMAGSLAGIGEVHYYNLQYSDALEFLLQSLKMYESIGDKRNSAYVNFQLGGLYAEKSFPEADPAKAIEYISNALELAETIGTKELIFKAHSVLAEFYEGNRNWEKAHYHYKRFHEMEKEVYNEESMKKIQDLEHQQKFMAMELEKKATFKILNRVLPRQIVDRVKNGEENIADKFPSASVLFADIVGFTPLAEKLGADEVLKLLSSIFSHFDNLCEKFGVEKIKTVGDSYMAASGIPVECEDHLLKIAKLAIAMQEDIKVNLDFKIPELSIRIGIHTGEVIAGVLGTQKLSYDIWGDTVNTAARMESHGEPDMIHCTEEVFKALNNDFIFKERGEMEIKGKGVMKTYFLTGAK
jgi:class 3 adenylate cyclase/uncharacterized protein HemY